MKKKHFILASLVFCGAVASCGYLDEEPYHYLTPEAALITEENWNKLYNEAYSFITSGHNHVGGAFLDCATDDGMATNTSSNIHKLAHGNISQDNTIVSPWTNMYRGIHQALYAKKGMEEYKPFLAGKTPEEVDRLVNQYYYELDALRALYEFVLLQYYGGVPIIDQAYDLSDQEELSNRTRDSFSACVEHIVALCDTAANHLGAKPAANTDYGRMTKGAALAIKAKTLVYAASPLYNRSGNDNPFIGYTEATVPEDYPTVEDRYKRAAAACASVINLQADGSISPGGKPVYSMVAVKNAAAFNTNIFNADAACLEWIVFKTNSKANSLENRHYPPSLSKNSGGGTVPTQDLINAFTAKDGSDVPEPKNGEATVYAGRDMRFDAFIGYEGSNQYRSKIYTHTGDGATLDALNAKIDYSTTTGYYLVKFFNPKVNFTQASPATPYHIWPIIRISDIYLLYAEAMVGGYGDFNVDPEGYGLSALDAVKAVRARAGFDPGTDKFYDGIASAEDFMEKIIKRERRIELCFEEQRYFDLRRWLDAEEVLNRPVHGADIYKNGSNLTYTYFEADSRRVFTPNMYFHPIPKGVLKVNKAIVQNPGY